MLYYTQGRNLNQEIRAKTPKTVAATQPLSKRKPTAKNPKEKKNEEKDAVSILPVEDDKS